MHSTNYYNTLIEIAEDCPAKQSKIPPVKGDKKSVANLKFEMLHEHPYKFTWDNVLFAVFAERKQIPEQALVAQRHLFFAKGQPCFRASPLTKRYGWGVHSNEAGKIALIGIETEAYQNLVADNTVAKKKAMRAKRA
jgi:hypothetical protein